MGLDFPNLPYFIDADGTRLTETKAIAIYIADKYKPELLGKTPEERAKVEMLCGVLFDKLGVITKIMFGGDESDRSQTEELMKPIANWLY